MKDERYIRKVHNLFKQQIRISIINYGINLKTDSII